MKPCEKGFTLIELVIGLSITVIVAGAAGAAIFQIFGNTERASNHMTVVRQVQNAGYWISLDAQMALSVTTDNLSLPVFLTFNWTEDAAGENPIYHSANYTIEDLSNNTGTLIRSHSTTEGASEQTLVAKYIYYNPADTDNSTQASYDSPLLSVQITALFEERMETREYKVKQRPTTFTY
ncbi:prepilin-type N-terminal cleavage/methylation domain-containing protein [Chloroflexota bacterium]